jgi:hypothetical protein
MAAAPIKATEKLLFLCANKEPISNLILQIILQPVGCVINHKNPLNVIPVFYEYRKI